MRVNRDKLGVCLKNHWKFLALIIAAGALSVAYLWRVMARSIMNEAKENTGGALDTGESWVFELTNLQFRFGDEKTTIPLPPGAPPGSLPGFLLNRIPFSINGRADFAAW